MRLLLPALLIAVPLAEILVFIEVGGAIGAWPTVGLVVLTALIGVALLRHQGLSVLARARAELAARRMPVRALFDGVCLLVGGALLLTPGFLTDAIGFALLVPPLRRGLGMWLWWLAMRHGHVRATAWSTWRDDGATTIDAEDWEVARDDDDDPALPPRRGR